MNLQDEVTEQSLYDPTPNGYSMAVNVPCEARVTYISGRDGQDSTGALSPDLAVQVKQAYANLRTDLDVPGARYAAEVRNRIAATTD
jgi:enamine deaminase RidA (YjgF/YER057c/UK114 family)